MIYDPYNTFHPFYLKGRVDCSTNKPFDINTQNTLNCTSEELIEYSKGYASWLAYLDAEHNTKSICYIQHFSKEAKEVYDREYTTHKDYSTF
jgi:hypothetical protein